MVIYRAILDAMEQQSMTERHGDFYWFHILINGEWESVGSAYTTAETVRRVFPNCSITPQNTVYIFDDNVNMKAVASMVEITSDEPRCYVRPKEKEKDPRLALVVKPCPKQE